MCIFSDLWESLTNDVICYSSMFWISYINFLQLTFNWNIISLRIYRMPSQGFSMLKFWKKKNSKSVVFHNKEQTSFNFVLYSFHIMKLVVLIEFTLFKNFCDYLSKWYFIKYWRFLKEMKRVYLIFYVSQLSCSDSIFYNMQKYSWILFRITRWSILRCFYALANKIRICLF